jgi:hypothetical protein
MKVKRAPLVILQHQDDVRLRVKYFATKADHFLQSLFISDPSSRSQDYRHWQNTNLIFHKTLQEKVELVLFPSQMKPVSTNSLYHFLIDFTSGRSFWNFLLNCRWRGVTEVAEQNFSTQTALSFSVPIFMPALQWQEKLLSIRAKKICCSSQWCLCNSCVAIIFLPINL